MAVRLDRRSTWFAGLLVAAALALVPLASGEALAQAKPKSKSVQSDARWVSFDAEAKTATLKIVKPGKILDKAQRKAVKPGKEIVFDVRPEGSVLTRTTVAINGMKSEISDIAPGKSVYVYWVADDSKPNGRFARKIDVVFSREELEERYKMEDVE